MPALRAVLDRSASSATGRTGEGRHRRDGPAGSGEPGREADASIVDPDDAARMRELGRPSLLRLSPLRLGLADGELDAAVATGPAAIWLLDAIGLPDVERLGAKLAVREAEHGLPDGAIRIVAVLESAAGLLASSSLAARPPPRLAALACDEAALRAALRCGPQSPALAAAVGQALLAAAAAALPALAVAADASAIEAAARDGFSGAVVREPGLVAAARDAFRPGSGGRG